MRLTSATTTHDMIHLSHENGSEHALRLQNRDLSVRETHLLTAMSLVRKGRRGGPYVAIQDHTLNETDYDEKLLAKMHRSVWILLPVSGGIRALRVAVGLGSWWYRGIAGRKQLIASGQPLRLAGV